MPEQLSQPGTPLQNLFYYIRDLYNTSKTCYDFRAESIDKKEEGTNFWKVEDFISLNQFCTERKNVDFSFPTSIAGHQNDYVLKVKRRIVPKEPTIPTELKKWIAVIHQQGIPELLIKDEIEVVEAFDASKQRIIDYQLFREASSAHEKTIIPKTLDGWLELIGGDYTAKKELKRKVFLEEIEGRQMLAVQLRKEFKQYVSDYEIPIRVNQIYDAFHTLYYELKGKENKKLFISFGLVTGNVGGAEYYNFLFHVPLRLTLKNEMIILEKDTFSDKVFAEQHFVELLDVHFKMENALAVEQRKNEVLTAFDRFNLERREFLFDHEFIKNEYYNRGLEMLGVFSEKQYNFFKNNELWYEFDEEISEDRLRFSFSPIIQTKTVVSNLLVSKDANNIAKKIDELIASDQLDLIPDFFKKLFSIEGKVLGADGLNFKPSFGEDKTTYSHSIEFKPLFPLPYNNEQLEIAKRLNEQDAVTVKGPPGTGKSHTIANLISNYVAQGKSILVVSHNSKALRVLKDKLPGAIQALAISMVSERKGNEDVKASVDGMIRNLSIRYSQEKASEYEEQLQQLENRYADILVKTYRAVGANSTSYKLYNPLTKQQEEKLAYDWARYYIENKGSHVGFVKDEISYECSIDGLSDVLESLFEIGNALEPLDFGLIKYKFLPDGRFIDLHLFRELEDKILTISQSIDLDKYSAAVKIPISDSLLNDIQEFVQYNDQFKDKVNLKELFTASKFDFELLRRVLQSTTGLRSQILSVEAKLLQYDIDLGPIDELDPDILFEQINKLIVKFGDNKTLGLLGKTFLDKQLKQFFDCKINFIPVNNRIHLGILEIEIQRRKSLKQLSIILKNYLKTARVSSNESPLKIFSELEFIQDFYKRLSALNKVLLSFELSEINISSRTLGEDIEFLNNLKLYFEYEDAKSLIWIAKQNSINEINSHPLNSVITEAIGNIDRASYFSSLGDYKILREKQDTALKFYSVFDKLAVNLPFTANAIKDSFTSGNDLRYDKSLFEKELFLLKIKDFLRQVTSETKEVDGLLSDLQNIKGNIERQTAETIAYKAWHYKSQRVTDTQRAALTAWKNDLINIGQGYGRNTAKNMASAVRNMQIAKEAVPIWIMKQELAIDFFADPSPAQFDLLIIDEASQCDISSLNLIFRSKKCLIVGDENQTSVIADKGVFSIDRTNMTLDRYLNAHPFKRQFDVHNKNNSIYTISGVIYPNIVALSEHFRCLPEIIGFSNKHVYNNDIIPLKTATEKIFGDPIVYSYVEDSFADESKPAIVDAVEKYLTGFIKEFESNVITRLPTIGVITLDSSNLRHQNLLVKKISSNELIKRYEDKLELLIGTSREFQGDERDVIIMTIAASHSIDERGGGFEMKPPRSVTSEEYMRIFNVAASRAKEKSILVHSIHPNAVSLMKSDCYRKNLIDYYQSLGSGISDSINRKNLQSLLASTDTNSGDFEREVCKLLYNNGFGDFLTPQFKIGPYRIDFGLIINNRKLALECDGVTYHSGMLNIKQDINRQLILERAGWSFFRIQSTDWFYHNAEVSSKLLSWIKNHAGEVPSLVIS